jgi:predicted metal-dependent phosphoesterase TrpH
MKARLRYAGNHDLISRTHFARFLVETGRLQRHLRGVSQIPHRRQARLRGAPLGQSERPAVTWITEAGGVAVIAHPARYKFTANEEFALFTEFKGPWRTGAWRWSLAATQPPRV